MSRKKCSVFLYLFMSVILILTTFYQFWVPAYADGEHADITQDGITYVYEEDNEHPEESCHHGAINAENCEAINGTSITVPDGCKLHVEADVTLTSLTVSDGGFVEILSGNVSLDSLTVNSGGTVEVKTDELSVGTLNLSADSILVICESGRLNVTTVTAADGAHIILESDEYKPDAITLYDPEGQEERTGFIWTDFVFNGTQWIEFVEEADPAYEFVVVLDGCEPEIVTVTYSIDGGNTFNSLNSENSWSNTSGTDTYEVGFGIHDDGWDPYQGGTAIVKVELFNTTKVMAMGGLGEFDLNASSYVVNFDLSSQPQEYSYTFSNPSDVDNVPHDMHFALTYPNSGDGAIVNEVNNYIYGYPDNTSNSIENLFAKELYYRFIEVAMFENFNISSPSDLEARIETSGAIYTINVTLADGTTATRSAQNYVINWGTDAATGAAVTQTIPVYTLLSDSEFLVCTNFNESNGTGSTFYSRVADSDEVDFSGAGDTACAITLPSLPNMSNIQIGGNGADKYVMNDDGIYSYMVYTFPQIQDHLTETTQWPRFFNTHCRIMSSAKEYVVLTSSGENKAYGGLGLHGRDVDSVWTTGSGSQTQNAYVYIGETTVSLEAINGSGKTVTGISLKNASQASGVTITGNTLHFECNFYDTVPVNITFSDGSTKTLTINRIGLVIQYSYLIDNGTPNDAIHYDWKTASASFTRDYNSGEQILVYATYYHPTIDNTAGGGNDLYLNLTFQDGTSRIVYHVDDDHNFNGYLAAGGGEAVATTSFIIGFAPAKQWDGYAWVGNITQQTYSEGAFYATVLNAGYNDNDTYGGTQTGSGKGVYWDGHITWYE